jgi:hypothetical protein
MSQYTQDTMSKSKLKTGLKIVLVLGALLGLLALVKLVDFVDLMQAIHGG